MLKFNTLVESRSDSGTLRQVFKAVPPIPTALKTSLVALFLAICCLSPNALLAQCNIGYQTGPNINLSLGFAGNVTLNSNVFIPFVSSPNCPNGTIEIWQDINANVPFPPTTYTCADHGTVVNVFVTIEGPFSQSNAIPFVVTIVDDVPPLVTWPSNVTAPADPAACARVVNSLTPVVTDNCSGSYVVTWTRTGATPGSGSGSANGVYNVGTTQVNFAIDDLNIPGNPNATHTTTVTITDSQPPTITPSSLPNLSANANASCQASLSWNGGVHPVANDNCALMFPATLIYRIQMTGATTLAPQNPSGVAMPFTFNLGTTTVTYSAFDGVNTTTVSFTVTVSDVTPPSFGAAPTVSNVAAVNCAAPVNIDLNGFITDNCTINANLTKTFTVTSASSGNSPYPLNVAQPGAHVNATFQAGVYTIVFKATDAAGNMQTHNLTLTVVENTAPVAVCQNFVANLGANGTVTVLGQNLDGGSTDNCAVTVWEFFYAGNWQTSYLFNCGNIGNINVLFRVKDAAGNISPTCGPVTITVQDAMPPVAQCKDIVVNLDQAGNTQHTVLAADVNNMSYDNCTAMGALVLGISENFGGPFGPSVIVDCADVPTPEVVYLRVTDAQGNNSNICVSNVTVNDVTNPVAIAQNYVAVLGANGQVSVCGTNINNASTDNCGIVEYRIGTSASGPFTQCRTYTCANLGANNAWLQVVDVDGNTNVAGPVTVTVQDNTPPVANCQSVTAYLNNLGQVTVLASALNSGSTDNCTIVTYQIALDIDNNGVADDAFATSKSFNCFNIGTNNVIFRAIDQSGNISNECSSAAINVVDNLPPTLACYATTVPLLSNGTVTVFPIQIAPVSFDNCQLASLLISVDANNDNNPDVPFDIFYTFTCNDAGVNNVLIQATDIYGNSTVCNSPLTVQDTEDPVITCPADLTIQCDDDQTPANTGSATAVDNCPSPTILPYVDFIDPLSNVCVGTYVIERTWTAEDNFGNTSSCVQIINVEDTEAPSFTRPANVVLDCPDSYTVANQYCNDFAASAGLPLAINPIGSGVYNATLNINVPDNGKIMDINLVDLVIEHTWIGDITVQLISPAGTIVTMANFGGCGGNNNADINFDDEAASGVYPCPPTDQGFYIPAGALSNFDGEFINGTWTLRITDNANFDGGALVSWGIDACYVSQPEDLTYTGDVTDETDNCDAPEATFVDFHAYKDFINHNEGGAYNFDNSLWVGAAVINGSYNANSTTLTMVSDNDGGGGDVSYTYNNLPANGFIVFDWTYNSNDDGSFWDQFGYSINGIANFVPIVDVQGFGGNSQSGQAIIPVVAGDDFAFVQRSVDGLFGAATTVVTNFLFHDGGMPVPVDDCERKFCVARVWSLSDDCGNAAPDQVQIIETRDITAPEVNFPTTMNVLAQNGTCNPQVNLDLTTFISDACSDYEDLIITNNALADYGIGNGTDDATGFYPPGSYSITFTVTDECGNVTNHSITLNVIDTQNPTAICQDATIQLDNSGNAILTPASIDNGSYDNCAVTSMTVTPNMFTTADIGPNTVTLTVYDAAGNVNSCNATVMVLGGVMFDAGDASGGPGTTVLVPVTVTNFDNIISFDVDFDIINGAVATVNQVEGIHPSLAGMLFSVTGPTTVTTSWIGGPLSLADGTVAFSIRVNLVGSPGQSTPILTQVNEVGNNMGLTPGLGLAGTISIYDPGTVFTISGTLAQHPQSGNTAVHLATVDYYGSVNGTIPNVPGAFSFNVPGGSNITVEPSKDINWNGNGGVTTLDALCTHYYSVGLPLPAPCTGPVTPYHKIAADANANNVVTAFDAALIQQIALSNTPVPGNTSWRFVPTVPALPSDPFAGGFDETLSYTNINANINNANFYGIKTGDVTATYTNGVTAFGGDTGDRSGSIVFAVADMALTAGQEVTVNLKSKDFTNIFSVQTTLNFDASMLEFVGANGTGLPAMLFNTTEVANGKLALSWYDLNGATIADGQNLFSLTFKVKSEGILSSLLGTSSEIVAGEVGTVDGVLGGVDIVFESFTATEELDGGHFALYQNTPNPFSTRTSIGFNLPKSDNVTLTITDPAGKVVKVVEGYFTAGKHHLNVERKELPATGVLFYQLKTAEHEAVKKMILVD